MTIPIPQCPPELKERYLAAAHAMQSGVAAKLAAGSARECEPKHLRVGVNSALVDGGAMARVLIAKGVITAEEYFTSVVECMEEEAQGYERELGVRLA